MLKQYIAVLAPLLTKDYPNEIYCIRAVIKFITIAQYRSHDEKTLIYISTALHKIDLFKNSFTLYRPQDKDFKYGHFNFPKFHAISHYPEWIRQYNTADGVNTFYNEAFYKYQIKEYYNRTNKRNNYLD